jgi:hypothetical protein
MDDAATTVAKKRPWRPLVWGLIAFLICPLVPIFEGLIPIQQTLLLLIPIVAACSIVDWKLGGRLVLSLIWLALTVWMLLQPAGTPGTQYDQMARGWAILLAASFGLVSLWGTATPFFSRALVAVGLSMGVAFVLALSSPSGIARFQHAGGEEITRRVNATIQDTERSRSSPEWTSLAGRVPGLDDLDDKGEDMMRQIPTYSTSLLPALLALESLAVLALGWGLYQRLVPERIGPPLGPLSEFRFNDQLVWGLAVGTTLSVLPAFQEARNAGYNLLVFFGALYLIRGIGVLAWMARGRYVYVVILGLIPQVFLIVTLALGLGDTWLDIRRRVRAA